MSLKITSWNVNSVRLRLPLIADFLQKIEPDVLCLQETKCRDAEFPAADFRKLGYEHLAVAGQKGYHGVALVSRAPLETIERRDFCQKGDARHVAATVRIGGRAIRLHNFYVPAGGDEPDPLVNPKFEHKLAFLDEMRAWTQDQALAAGDAVFVGDFNVAPLEHDVWSHKALLSVVSHTPVETEKLTALLEAGPFVDALRHFTPADQKLYTWWSYRAPDWAKANKGRRLDHIWVSPSLKGALASVDILKEARGWERPSDHAPVTLTLEF